MSKLTDAIEANMLEMAQRTALLARGNPQPVLTQEQIIKHIHAQAKSADMWIGQWEQYKDVSGVRNASLAIGKLFGLYAALLVVNGGDHDAPEEIIAMMNKYQNIWDNLHISRTIADAISKHG